MFSQQLGGDGSGVLQSAGDDTAQPLRVLIFYPWNLDSTVDIQAQPASESSQTADIIFQSAQNKLGTSGYEIVAAEPWESYLAEYASGDPFGTLPLEIGVGDNVDIALSLYFRLEGEQVFLMAKAYDIRGRRIIAGDSQIARNGLVLLNSIEGLLRRMISQISESEDELRFMKQHPGRLTGTAAARVIFHSENEGARLSMPGLENFAVIRDGYAELPYQPLALGQTLEVTMELEGYYARTQSFLLTDQNTEVELQPMYPATKFASEFGYNIWFLYGFQAGMRYYIVPDSMFLRLSNQLYFDPPAADAPSGAKTLVHEDLSIEYGNYLFFPAENRYRLSYAFGFGFSVTPLTSETRATDVYFNLAAIHHELNWEHFGIFLRQELRYVVPVFDNRLWDTGVGMTPPLVPLHIGVMIKW